MVLRARKKVKNWKKRSFRRHIDKPSTTSIIKEATLIYIAAINIGLFISVLILIKKTKTRSDWLLFIWMIINSLNLLFFYLVYSELIYDYPHIIGLNFPIPLLHGVFLYLYVSSVTNNFPRSKLVLFLHFLPAILCLLYLIPFFGLAAQEKIEIFRNQGKDYQLFQTLVIIGIMFSGVIYVIWSSLLLRRHKKRIRDQFSDVENIDLNWLQFLTIGLGLIWVLVIFTQDDNIIFTGVSIFIILIGVFGIRQKNIFNEELAAFSPLPDTKLNEAIEIKEPNEKKEKYVRSGLTPEMSEKIFDLLDKAMNQDELYKETELSLNDLARKLNTHPNYISQILNERLGVSFYDYINNFRIEEFKRLIAEPKNQQFTVLALAFDCGFNSKSSFNRYFKKMTNQTPSQYLKSLKS